MPREKKEPKAKLIIEIHYGVEGCLPDRCDLDEIVDKCREYGHVVRADYETLAPVKESLI